MIFRKISNLEQDGSCQNRILAGDEVAVLGANAFSNNPAFFEFGECEHPERLPVADRNECFL